MRAWLEIDLEKVGQNVDIVKQKTGVGVELIAVVKSDAYGHGLPAIVEYLDDKGIDMWAVIDIDEAYQVRQLSRRPILVMGYVDSKELVDAIEEGFILSLYDKELAPYYERVAARLNKQLRVHLKVETGLNRLGMSGEDAADFLISQRHFPHLKVEAIFSHLASAAVEEENIKQLRRLQDLLVKVQGKCDVLPIHLVSSAALGSFKEGYFDAVRIGLALYGVDEVLPGLQPVTCCKSVVMQVKPVARGEGISYNHIYTAKNDMTIAVVALGYGEGLSQALTGRMSVLINGQEVPVVGQISMNLIIADVTGREVVKRGDEVVIIGSQKDKAGVIHTLSVADLAKRSAIRHHEIVTRMGRALPRRYYPRRSASTKTSSN